MNILKLIKEAKVLGRGSLEGRTKGLTSNKKSHAKASKSKVRVFRSITDALSKGYPGLIFSTRDSDRLYVITKQKWGHDDEQMVGGKTAKGFSEGTPFDKIKGYAARTLVRHGKQSSKNLKSYFKKGIK